MDEMRRPLAEGPPWERRAAIGALRALLDTVVGSALRPTAFFRSLRPTGNLRDAALFGIGIVVLTTLVQVAWVFVVTPIPFLILSREGISPGLPLAVAFFSSWIKILSAPVLAAIGLVLLAGIFHGGLVLLGAAARPFETTLRILCYSTPPLLLGLLPFCGGTIGKAWALVLVVIGIRECHLANIGQAIVAVFLPVLVLGGCFGALLWIALAGRILFQG
ncbi:MAG: YIP1 family protein [Candidatus Eisenbacteria bacterium]|nr:YIP1 family protein [Candidatus Eisenbacteria bacterium]